MNERVLISFLGGHDLNCDENFEQNPCPLIQMINNVKPKHLYLFITYEYMERYKNSFIQNNINKIAPDLKINEIFIDIINPTDTNEINSKISPYIKDINNFIVLNKNQGFVNLTSGTPQIISVLTLNIIIDKLQKTHGAYAPNPKFDSKYRVENLNFFKNSFGYETIKTLIENYDYSGIISLSQKDNYIKSKFQMDKDINEILEFAHNKFISDFKKANEILENNALLKEKFEIVKIDENNTFNYCIERFFTINPLIKTNQLAQAVIWIAIIRETLINYINNILLPNGMESIAGKEEDSSVYYLNEEKIKNNYDDLYEFLMKEWDKNKCKNTLDLNRELNQAVAKLIFKYSCENFIEDKNISRKLQSSMFGLEEVVKVRNNLAHTICPPKFNKNWINHLKNLINNILILNRCEINLNENPYDRINNLLQEKISEIFVN